MSVAVGFRAKTGRAIAVVLAAPARFIWRGEVSLIDASMSRDTGPYHLVMELPWSESEIAVQKYVKPIQAVATRMLASLMKQHAIGAVAVVGSPDRNLAKIGNEHIRAHAAEGRLGPAGGVGGDDVDVMQQQQSLFLRSRGEARVDRLPRRIIADQARVDPFLDQQLLQEPRAGALVAGGVGGVDAEVGD